MEPRLDPTLRGDRLELVASGPWTATHVGALERLIEGAAAQAAPARRITVDMAGIAALDTLGAWLIERLLRAAAARGQQSDFANLPERYRGLFEELRRVNRRPTVARARGRRPGLSCGAPIRCSRASSAASATR